jgi:hypothetical protein
MADKSRHINIHSWLLGVCMRSEPDEAITIKQSSGAAIGQKGGSANYSWISREEPGVKNLPNW